MKKEYQQGGGVSTNLVLPQVSQIGFNPTPGVLPLTSQEFLRGLQASVAMSAGEARKRDLAQKASSAFMDLQDDFFGIPIHNENQRQRLATIAQKNDISPDDFAALNFSDSFAVRDVTNKYRKAILSPEFTQLVGEVGAATQLRDLAFQTLKNDPDGLAGFLSTWGEYQLHSGDIPFEINPRLLPPQFMTPETVDFIGKGRTMFGDKIKSEEDKQMAKELFNNSLLDNPAAAERQGFLIEGEGDVAKGAGFVLESQLTPFGIAARDAMIDFQADIPETVSALEQMLLGAKSEFASEARSLAQQRSIKDDDFDGAAQVIQDIVNKTGDENLSYLEKQLRKSSSEKAIQIRGEAGKRGIDPNDKAGVDNLISELTADDDTGEKTSGIRFKGTSDRAIKGNAVIDRLAADGLVPKDKGQVTDALDDYEKVQKAYEHLKTKLLESFVEDNEGTLDKLSEKFESGFLDNVNVSVKSDAEIETITPQAQMFIQQIPEQFNIPTLVFTSGVRHDGSTHVGGDNFDVRTDEGLPGGETGTAFANFLMTPAGVDFLDGSGGLPNQILRPEQGDPGAIKAGTDMHTGYDAIWEFKSEDDLPEGFAHGQKIGGVTIKVDPSINNEHLHLQARFPSDMTPETTKQLQKSEQVSKTEALPKETKVDSVETKEPTTPIAPVEPQPPTPPAEDTVFTPLKHLISQ